VDTNGAVTTLASFDGTNGTSPHAELTPGSDGNFYGIATYGGANGDGSIFQVTTNGTLTLIASFADDETGSAPLSGLTQIADGVFIGTTSDGGGSDLGTVVRATTDGGLTQLLSFDFTNGAFSHSALALGADGNLSGTTVGGGATGNGTVFQLTTNGELTTLVSLAVTNGAGPVCKLALGPDGNFYGVTSTGGSENVGTVFRLLIAPQPIVIQVVSFSPTNVVLSFPMVAGQSYTLQESASLTDPVWSDDTNIIGDASLFQINIPVSHVLTRFFRVREP